MTGNSVIDLIFLALVIFAIIYYLILTGLTRLLRERHSKVWISLGEPGFSNYSIRNSNRLSMWILFRGDYRALGDRDINKMIIILRAIAIVQAALLLVILIWRYS
jgi:hypothetical protein